MAGGGADVALALETLTLKETCAHCGKQRSSLKRCSRCKQVSYCGAECQNAGWKKHKKACMSPEERETSLKDIFLKIVAADEASDWRGVLAWEGRMEEIMVNRPDSVCEFILLRFAAAHTLRMKDTTASLVDTIKETGEFDWGSGDLGQSARAFETLETRRIALLGKMLRFRDMGEAQCLLGEGLLAQGKAASSSMYLQQARDVGAAHGFFSVECRACLGLGQLAILAGRSDEGLDLLRNALAAVPLDEDQGKTSEMTILTRLTDELIKTHAFDELETLQARYRTVAKAESRRKGQNICWEEMCAIYSSARLHEAHGRPEEAVQEWRLLQDLPRENPEAVWTMPHGREMFETEAGFRLKFHDPATSERERKLIAQLPWYL